MQVDFTGKRALVTGAGRGFGREIVQRLVAAGAQVVATSKTAENLQSLKNEIPSIETVCADISNWNETKKAIEKIGPIDLLVNNAGVTKLSPSTENCITEEEIDFIFNINVKAVVNVTQIVAKGMIERKKGGAIVNVSSLAGIVALQDHLIYSASKAAVDAMTKNMALEYGPHGIRTNSINPTVVLTDMGRKAWADEAKASALLAKIPLRKFGEVSEIGDVVLYLLSDRSSMINGVILPVDGGYAAC